VWSYTTTLSYVFMAWCLVKHRDNFETKARRTSVLSHTQLPQRKAARNMNISNSAINRVRPHSCTALSFSLQGKVKLSVCLTKYHAMKMHVGVEVLLYAVLTSAQDVNGQLHAPVVLPTGTHRIGRKVGGRQSQSGCGGVDAMSFS
jgi:hypothetical protein